MLPGAETEDGAGALSCKRKGVKFAGWLGTVNWGVPVGWMKPPGWLDPAHGLYFACLWLKVMNYMMLGYDVWTSNRLSTDFHTVWVLTFP